MIALDTNVVARLFVSDDSAQVAAARGLFEKCRAEQTPVYVSTIVLCELVWTLRSKFRLSRLQLQGVVKRLLTHPIVVLDDKISIETAYSAWLTGPADFSDYVIAALSRDRGATTTYTFDSDAAKSPAFTLL